MNKMEELVYEDILGAGDVQMEPAAEKNDEDDTLSPVVALAHILDAMMGIFFEYLQRHLGDKEANSEVEGFLVPALMNIFEGTIVQTTRARCVQFVWFYFASLRPAWAETLLSQLLVGAFSPNMAILRRLVSLGYLASFIARAKFLTTNFTLRTAQYVVALANEQLVAAEDHIANGHHSHPQVQLFLYAVQAVCYILCFQMDHFAEPLAGDNGCHKNALSILLHDGGADIKVD